MQVTNKLHILDKISKRNILIWSLLLLFDVVQTVRLAWMCLFDFGHLRDEIGHSRKEEM